MSKIEMNLFKRWNKKEITKKEVEDFKKKYASYATPPFPTTPSGWITSTGTTTTVTPGSPLTFTTPPLTTPAPPSVTASGYIYGTWSSSSTGWTFDFGSRYWDELEPESQEAVINTIIDVVLAA